MFRSTTQLSRVAIVSIISGTVALSYGFTRGHSPRFDQAAENRRVQMHLDSVLAELAGRDVRALPIQARSNRARLITRLAAYRNEASYPHNL